MFFGWILKRWKGKFNIWKKSEYNSYIKILIFHWIIGENTIWYWNDYNLCMLAKKTWQSSDVNNLYFLYVWVDKNCQSFFILSKLIFKRETSNRNTLNWIKWILNIFWLHYPNLCDTSQLFFACFALNSQFF